MAEVRLPSPVKATLVEDTLAGPPGCFEFYVHQDTGPEVMRGLIYQCPCGCRVLHALAFPPLSADDLKYGRHQWSWDGNREAPTLSPSINSHEDGDRNAPTHWHGFLTGGFFTQA
jgi:hypothetical protein